MKDAHRYQVREVARLTGVSVRTLHHYEAIGLLVPSDRSPANYRLYAPADLLRLQQILLMRTLGLGLAEIRRALDDPDHDPRAALQAQRSALAERLSHTHALIRSVDAALASLDTGEGADPMPDDPKTLFDGFDPRDYETEAEARWGHTDAFQESARRTKGYRQADWDRLKAEQAAVYQALARAKAEGKAPDAPEVMDLAEEARRLIERWFYRCPPAMHRSLADLYEADPRFTANIDRYGEGLTPFFAAAIRANAGRQGS